MAETDFPAAGFDTFDDFAKAAIKDYYDRGWKTRKGNFVALLIASGQAFALARDQVTSEGGIQKIAVGAGAVLLLRLGLRFALGGPLGMLLTGLSLASMTAYFWKNQKEITSKIPRYREILDAAHLRFDEIQVGYRAGRYDARERNLMVDGLHKRFLVDCDEL
jgi:hypothetical protein